MLNSKKLHNFESRVKYNKGMNKSKNAFNLNFIFVSHKEGHMEVSKDHRVCMTSI